VKLIKIDASYIINYVALSRTLRIIGERQIIGSKKSIQFDQSYPVPENCEVEKLQGKFEHGTLIVAMPKKFPSLKPQVDTAKEKSLASPRTPKGANIPSKSSTPPRVLEEPMIRDKKDPSSPSIVKGLIR
jgi:hypothetical protein